MKSLSLRYFGGVPAISLNSRELQGVNHRLLLALDEANYQLLSIGEPLRLARLPYAPMREDVLVWSMTIGDYSCKLPNWIGKELAASDNSSITIIVTRDGNRWIEQLEDLDRQIGRMHLAARGAESQMQHLLTERQTLLLSEGLQGEILDKVAIEDKMVAYLSPAHVTLRDRLISLKEAIVSLPLDTNDIKGLEVDSLLLKCENASYKPYEQPIEKLAQAAGFVEAGLAAYGVTMPQIGDQDRVASMVA